MMSFLLARCSAVHGTVRRSPRSAHAHMATGPADRFPFLHAVDACVCVFDEAGEVLYRSWGHGGMAVDLRYRQRLLEHAARAAHALFDGGRGERAADRGDGSAGSPSHGMPVEVDGRRFRLCGSLVDGHDRERRNVAVVTIHPGDTGSNSPEKKSRALHDAGRRYGLTRREVEVAALVVARRTNREIADGLGISVHTVRHHVERILSKLGLHSRRQVGVKLRSSGRERS